MKLNNETPDTERANNSANLFVYRYTKHTDSSRELDPYASSPTMFWRSPYVGDRETSASGTMRLYMNPIVSVTSAKQKQLMSVDDTSKLTKKSILKHRKATEDENEVDDLNTNLNQNDSMNTTKPNFITTGTGKGRPHGTSPRSKSGGKRVQFNGVTHQAVIPSENTVRGRFVGRRLYLDRSTSTRILGTTSRQLGVSRRRIDSSSAEVSVGGTEANIKTQINEFIRKLRLAESEKRSGSRSEVHSGYTDRESQRRTAAKLRKTKSFTETSVRPDWSEYDLDKISCSAKPRSDLEEDQNIEAKSVPSLVYDAKSRSVSLESMSIESFSSVNYDNTTVEQTSGGANVFRPKSNVSLRPKSNVPLNTSYRHITKNNMYKYGYEIYSQEKEQITKRENGTLNYCNKSKTNRIISWLEEVTKAQRTESAVNQEDTTDNLNSNET